MESCVDFRLQPRAPGSTVPLTSSQMGFWHQEVSQATHTVRICAAALRISGLLDVPRLKTCLEVIVRRHEALRTRIVTVNGLPQQKVDTESCLQLTVLDLKGKNGAHSERAAMRISQEFIDKKVDVSVGPLFEAHLLKLSNDEHVLIMMLHHIVGDAASCEILQNEMWLLYRQATQRVPFSLPELPIQFPDYAVWQDRTYNSWLAKHGSYWIELLADAPHTELPRDVRVSNNVGSIAEFLSFSFGKALSVSLQELARREKTLLPLVVLSLYIAVIAEWCNERDIVVQYISNGRYRKELKNVVGFLATVLHLRIKLPEGCDYLNLLAQVKTQFTASYTHNDLSRVGVLVAWCISGVYFDWAFVPRPQYPDGQSVPVNGLRVEALPFNVVRAKPFRPYFYCSEEGITLVVKYQPAIFSPKTVERVCRNILSLAEQVASR